MAQSQGHYEALDQSKQEIRLLEIVPSNDQSAGVVLNMFTRALKDATSDGFVPFSYVWGDASPTTTIIVNGEAKEIRQNLATLLLYAREYLLPMLPEMRAYKGKLLFWADAICINQDDVLERNHQVTLMRNVYGDAQVVISWLGIHENAHLAVELVTAINHEWVMEREKSNDQLNYDPDYKDWMSLYPRFWAKDCEEGVGNSYWNAVKSILDSDYWHRAWILQEIALPANPVIFFGSKMFHFHVLYHTCQWVFYLRSQSSNQKGVIDESLFEHLGSNSIIYLPIIRVMVTYMMSHLKRQSDLSLVGEFKDLKATDAKDKVYALLGLITTNIAADYRKSTEEVYSAYCSAWVNEIRDVQFLWYAGIGFSPQKSEARLPSWVPDWRSLSRQRPEMAPMADFPKGKFSSSSGIPVDSIQISGKSDILHVPGIICEEINDVHTSLPENPNDFCAAVLKWADSRVFAGTTNSVNGGLHALQVLFRTVLWDLDIGPPQRLDVNSSDVHTYFIHFLTLFVVPVSGELQPDWYLAVQEIFPRLGLDPGSNFANEYRNKLWPNATSVPQIDHWSDARTAIRHEAQQGASRILIKLAERISTFAPFHSKAMFMTKSRYVGVCALACPGDVIAVVAGCDVPVVLRKKGDYFELVGAAFVLGLMDGEAIERVKNGDAKEEMLEIH